MLRCPAYLGALFSDCVLSLSPRFSEASDKLETEKTQGREPGCETQTQHGMRHTRYTTNDHDMEVCIGSTLWQTCHAALKIFS